MCNACKVSHVFSKMEFYDCHYATRTRCEGDGSYDGGGDGSWGDGGCGGDGVDGGGK